jgi:uncharacterized membrane protein (UPF0127 family)
MALRLVNGSTGATVASDVELALDRQARRRGLLGRTGMPPASAMVLSPCWMVHTAFMQFPIDVLFVDGAGRILRVARDVRPWRAAMAMGGKTVIELPAGTATQRGVNVGDRVALVRNDESAMLPLTLPLEVVA